MAQVKFNRGTRAAIAQQSDSLTTDQVTFGSKPAGTYDSIYLGNFLVGTSMIGLMTPAELKTPVYTYTEGQSPTVTYSTDASIDATSGTGHFEHAVITADWNGTSAITTARRLVDWKTINAGGYTLTDSDILTAKAVTSLISASAGNTWYQNFTESNWTWTAAVQDTTLQTQTNLSFTLPIANTSGGSYDPSTDATHLMTADQIYAVATGNNTYHGTGTWDSTEWNVYTAKYYKNGTEVASGATGYQALSFTLPVHTWSNAAAYAADNTHLTTPKQVADYLATFTSAMNYRGQLTNAMATGTHSDAYQIGDVFIASEAITSIGAEAGDMVVVKTAIPANTAFVSTGTGENCDVFERNLDGAVTADATLAENHMVVGDTADKEVKTVAYITVDDTHTDLVIAHTVGNETTNVNVAEGLIWHELS
jgi:hypothetical protein